MTINTLWMGKCHDLAWLDAKCPPKLLCHSPSSVGQERKNTAKDSWVEIRAGRDHSAVTITGKTGSTWRNQLNLSSIKSE